MIKPKTKGLYYQKPNGENPPVPTPFPADPSALGLWAINKKTCAAVCLRRALANGLSWSLGRSKVGSAARERATL
jgi:hypothetical protein